MKTEQSNRSTLMLIVAFLVIAVALLYGIVAEYRQLKSVQAEIDVAEAQLMELEQRLQRLLLLKEQEQELLRQVELAKEALPEYLSDQDLIDEIQTAALLAGCQVTEFRFLDLVVDQRYVSIPFDLTLEGEFAGLMRFLDILDQEAKIYRIDGFSVKKSSSGDLITADLQVSSFYVN